MRRALLICALLFSSALAALEVPPAPTRWVTDAAGILGPTEADLLNRKLADFEQSSGAQFIIYILPSLQGDAVEDFTIRAVEKWKAGQKKYDNGLVLFVFVQDRKARVEVGYGLEGTITDALASRVIREQLAPAFRQNQYAQGLNAAADELMARIRKGEAPVEPLQPRGTGQEAAEPQGIPDALIAFAVLFIVFFFIVPMFAGGRRRRRSGGCGGCFFPMFFFPGGGGITFGGGGFGGGGFSGGGFGGGGFSGGGGGFGGGGATGGW